MYMYIFEKDYDRNIQYVKFFKKVNKQVKTEAHHLSSSIMSREGLRVGRGSRAHFESQRLYISRNSTPWFDHNFFRRNRC